MHGLKKHIRSLVPASLLSIYHLSIAYAGAIIFGFPSRSLLVIGVTGTKGKTSTTEMIGAIFEAAGRKTALLNSIRIKVAGDSEPNLMRMSMPGRFFIQRFLARARKAKCTVTILEMTSEGSRQHRHRGVALDALVFTNLAPEHIESHGSFEAYADAKYMLGRALARSHKRPRAIAALSDDRQSARYLALPVEKKLPYSLALGKPWSADEHGGFFTFGGTKMSVPLPGEFSLKNALAAATIAHAFGISTEHIRAGLASVRRIPGRAERIEEGQDFTVVVDYAHTPDSLEALYKAYGTKRKICILGSMGGTRDSWNRPVKGKLAGDYCEEVILTDEDPCDDDPMNIIEHIAEGVQGKTPHIIQDRREAIRKGLSLARSGDAVLITGKGTDPWMYGPNDSKIPWSDATIAREEIRRLAASARV